MVITTALDEATPIREDGEPWPLVVASVDQDGSDVITFADSHTEVLGALLAGYADISDTPEGHDDALRARYSHSVAVATAVQSGLAAEATQAGRFDPSQESEDVLTALFSDRSEPFTGVPAVDGTRSYDWQHEVPLVLIESDYEPFTGRRCPTGRIVWLRPTLENGYLSSLAEIGLIRYLVPAS